MKSVMGILKTIAQTFKTAICVLLMLSLSAVAWAQDSPYERVISGMVVDESGDPLPSAYVQQVLNKDGEALAAVITDFQGHFHLTVPRATKELQVTFVGYQSQKVVLDDRAHYLIRMQPVTELLNEVVVTGYQTLSRERTTGAFAKVDSKQLEAQRLSNISSLMEGRVAGYSNGRIRGVTSMNGLTTPLYVVDGFPVEKTTTEGYGWEEGVPDINMEDIENITVLKDAAATSIYGARAANGVVVITTKRAQKNRTDISFSATLTVQPYRYYTKNMADASTLIGLEKEWASQNPYLSDEGAAYYAQNLLDNAEYTTSGIRHILNYYAGKTSEDEMNQQLQRLASQGYRYYKDVEKLGKRNPFSQQYNLSIGKNTEKNVFNASVSYRHNQLEDKYSNNENLGINLKNSAEITRWLTLDLGTYLSYGSGTTQSYSLTSPNYTYLSYNGLTNNDGSAFVSSQEDRYSEWNLYTLNTYGLYNLDISPLDELGMNLTRQKDFSNRTFVRLNFKLTEWLKYTPSFQYQVEEYKTTQMKNQESYEVRNLVNQFATDNGAGTTFNIPYGNIYKEQRNSGRAYDFRQQLDFQKRFGERHDVTALAGMEIRENRMDYTSHTLYGYDPDLLSFSLVDAQTLTGIYGLWDWGWFSSSDVAEVEQLVNRYVSWYGNAAYTLDEKYTLTGSIRWDRTNLFATSSKYQKKPIWSVGAGWNLDRESFFRAQWVDMLKLRASYGIGGNIAKNSAPYMTTYYSSNTHVGGLQGTVSSRPNPNLCWEKTTTLNVGVDFALLSNRLSGSFEVYNKRGTDLLANTNGVPTEGWGYSTYSINNGRMINRGFELTLSADVVRHHDWSWNLGGTMGYNKNKVTYVNVEAPVLYLVFDYPTAYPRVGNPYNAIYAYRWAGLSEDGLPQVYDKEGNIYVDSEPTNIEDAVYVGTTVPKYNGALQTQLRYKNWELYAQMLFEGGHKMRNTNPAILDGEVTQVNSNISNRWQQPGDEAFTDIPRYVSYENPLYNWYSYSLYTNSTACILDATHWQLRNLSLTYHVPTAFCKKLSVRNARVMLGMENVFMIAKSRDAKWMLGGYERPNYLCSVNVNF